MPRPQHNVHILADMIAAGRAPRRCKKMTKIDISYLASLMCSFVMLILIGFLYVTASSIDYDVALRDERLYCEGVEADEHPDYKGIYEEVCK